MSKVAKLQEAEDVPGVPSIATISLTQALYGFDGKPLQIGDGTENSDMTLRQALLLSLSQGGAIADDKKELSDKERASSAILGYKIGNEDSTGITLTPAEAVLLKKLVGFRWRGPEIWSAILKIIYPTALEE